MLGCPGGAQQGCKEGEGPSQKADQGEGRAGSLAGCGNPRLEAAPGGFQSDATRLHVIHMSSKGVATTCSLGPTPSQPPLQLAAPSG